MLVLTRKAGESLMIGEEVEVKIIAVDGNYIKLGIAAPRSVSVFRKEVYDKIKGENVAAAAAAQLPDIDRLAGLLKPKKQ